MRLGIDASNLRAGGGLTHVVELLRAAEPNKYNISEVVVWSGSETLSRIENRPWLVKSHDSMLDRSLLHRTYWQTFRLASAARKRGCDVLFVPGGSYSGDFHPVVTMCRNMLPFEWRELRRYGWSWMTLKFLMLRVRQLATFARVDGLIFLTNYARDTLSRNIKNPPKGTRIIPHGIDERFENAPRPQLPISDYSRERPFRLLYVSIVDVYKHQWNVADAVAQLRAKGLPIVLELIGPAYQPALKRLLHAVEQLDPDKQFIKYIGAVPHTELHSHYQEADLCIFASSCENMPNILLEKMASGLPIACSDRGPMREVLGAGATYFNPEKPDDIARAIRELIESPEQRSKQASASYQRSRAFSWKTSADETLRFLSGVTACSLGISP